MVLGFVFCFLTRVCVCTCMYMCVCCVLCFVVLCVCCAYCTRVNGCEPMNVHAVATQRHWMSFLYCSLSYCIQTRSLPPPEAQFLLDWLTAGSAWMTVSNPQYWSYRHLSAIMPGFLHRTSEGELKSSCWQGTCSYTLSHLSCSCYWSWVIQYQFYVQKVVY